MSLTVTMCAAASVTAVLTSADLPAAAASAVLTPASLEGDGGDGGCPGSHAGWRSWRDEKCILFHSHDVDYETAERNCESIGAQLVTITSAQEEEFVTLLLMENARPNKSTASFFWIDGKKAIAPQSSSSSYSPMGTPGVKCPAVPRSTDGRTNPSSCPAKVVKHSKRARKKSFWCPFDCHKENVDAICEVIIDKRSETAGLESRTTAAADQASEQEVRDISRRSTSQFLPMTASPFTSIRSSLSSSSFASVRTAGRSTLPSLPSSSSSSLQHVECEVGWLLFTDKCYKFIQMDINGEDGSSLCLLHHSARLAAISSHALQQVIETLVSSHAEPVDRALLLGGRFDRDSRTFHWSTTGQAFRFTNWAPGHPDTRNECVAMVTDTRSSLFGSWITIDCKQEANLLCR